MQINKDNPKPLKQDSDAPEVLEILITDKKTGEVFLKEVIKEKHFSTGSVGYNCSAKMTNPVSAERYQVSCNITLIGSKPK